MSQRAIILTIFLFVLIIGGMFGFAFLKNQEVAQPVAEPAAEETTELAYPSVTRVTAKHFVSDGVHTLVGEIELPTPCDLLEARATVAESFPEQVTVDFSVINNALTCAQVRTPARFSVSFSASEEAEITARFMGRALPLNLVPPEPGETPEEFELFIKG